MPITRLAISLIISIAYKNMFTSGYISAGLPPHIHAKWLERMTIDICQSPPGNLTPEMLKTTPQLISAWSQNPYTSADNSSPSFSNKKNNKNKNKNKKSRCEKNNINNNNNNDNNNNNNKWGKECALEVERLLKRLVDERRAGNQNALPLNTSIYNCALLGWAKSGLGGPGAQRAEQILMEMQDLCHNGGELSAVQPNTASFKSVLEAWAQSKERSAPQRAWRVLEWMIELHQSGMNEEACPDGACFGIVLDLYAKSGQKQAAYRTEDVLLAMERLSLSNEHLYRELKPQTEHYNAVLTAWAWSEEEFSVDRAFEILHHMETLAATNQYDVKPNLSTYTSVIRACGRKGSKDNAMKANSILHHVETQYRAGDVSLRPDALIYNFAIDAWTKSNDVHAARHAKDILDRMQRMYEVDGVRRARPDACSYTSVISAAASTKSHKRKKDSFHLAHAVFRQLQNANTNYQHSIRPNDVTYGVMLKACTRLIRNQHQRDRYIKDIFEECRENGHVGPLVKTWLKNGASPELYHDLMADCFQKDTIPMEWGRNVHSKSGFTKRRGTVVTAERKTKDVHVMMP